MSNERDCEACPLGGLVERRAFVRDAVTSVLAGIGVLSLSARSALAMHASFARGVTVAAEKAYALPAEDGVVIDRDESVIVARFAGRAYAFSLACPHQNTAIRWESHNNRFQCPKHHSRYQPDGTFIEGRATRGLDRFAVRREGEQLYVNLDALYRQDENAVQWSAAFVVVETPS